jgi:FAD/FMN-containing dehydrogenase
VNDIHSGLNPTRVARVERPASVEALREALARARRERLSVAVCAGRHAMGGQQFATNGVLIDASPLGRVLEFDREAGQIEVEAGIQWPQLIESLLRIQRDSDAPGWGIAQKQTGADRLSLGGALAANAHGRGLSLRPMVADVEAFTLMDARGDLHRCSRESNPELFRLAIGGYGLFGVMTSVRLRLARRRKLERVVELVEVGDVERRFGERIREGYLFGDWQYSTALESDHGLRRGVFACYRPVADDVPIPAAQRELGVEDWAELLALSHNGRDQVYERYTRHYLATSGQIYWSDTHQESVYLDDYHRLLAAELGPASTGSEMISEVYVRRAELASFLGEVREDLLRNRVELIYGTVRLIEPDVETFLPWARERYACVIFNFHTQHDPAALEKTAEDFRRLIDRGLERGGSYFLTYHRWARRHQVLAAYPELPEFLRRKRDFDPGELFQSDWYRHHRAMLG